MSASLVYVFVAPPHRKPTGLVMFRLELVKKDVQEFGLGSNQLQQCCHGSSFLFVCFVFAVFVFLVVFVFQLPTTFSSTYAPLSVQSCHLATAVMKFAPTEINKYRISRSRPDQDMWGSRQRHDQDFIYQRQIKTDQKKWWVSFFMYAPSKNTESIQPSRHKT